MILNRTLLRHRLSPRTTLLHVVSLPRAARVRSFHGLTGPVLNALVRKLAPLLLPMTAALLSRIVPLLGGFVLVGKLVHYIKHSHTEEGMHETD